MGKNISKEITRESLHSSIRSKPREVQVTATRYVPTGTKFLFYVWGDNTVTLKSTDLPGTTPGTVTLPAFRLNLA